MSAMSALQEPVQDRTTTMNAMRQATRQVFAVCGSCFGSGEDINAPARLAGHPDNGHPVIFRLLRACPDCHGRGVMPTVYSDVQDTDYSQV